MTHLCSTDNHLSLLSLLVNDFLLFCSFLISHPLMLTYLLLLSPYLFQLFFFLYPLLFSTFLLLLSLLTVNSHLHEDPSTISPEFLGKTCNAVLNILCAELDAGEEEVSLIEQLCFHLCFHQIEPNGVDFYHNLGTDPNCKGNQIEQFPTHSKIIHLLESNLGDGGGDANAKEGSADLHEGKVSIIKQACFHHMEPNGVGIYYISGTNLNSEENPYEQFPNTSIKIKLLESNLDDGGGDAKAKEDSEEEPIKEEESATKANSPCIKEHSRRPSGILQRDGSMRKEKEWKRTLACKLFEERMTFKLCEERKVVDGAEEMDLLWEAYEVDAHKVYKPRRKDKDAKKAFKEEVQEEEEYDEEEVTGQLCCLQALRLSAGKMNLGVGRPSLVKISKALKGMALFHRAGWRSKKG